MAIKKPRPRKCPSIYKRKPNFRWPGFSETSAPKSARIRARTTNRPSKTKASKTRDTEAMTEQKQVSTVTHLLAEEAFGIDATSTTTERAPRADEDVQEDVQKMVLDAGEDAQKMVLDAGEDALSVNSEVPVTPAPRTRTRKTPSKRKASEMSPFGDRQSMTKKARATLAAKVKLKELEDVLPDDTTDVTPDVEETPMTRARAKNSKGPESIRDIVSCPVGRCAKKFEGKSIGRAIAVHMKRVVTNKREYYETKEGGGQYYDEHEKLYKETPNPTAACSWYHMPSVRWEKTSPNDVACPVPQCGRTFGSGKNTQHLLELHVARVVNEHKREFYEKSRQGGSYYDAHLEVYNKLSGAWEDVTVAHHENNDGRDFMATSILAQEFQQRLASIPCPAPGCHRHFDNEKVRNAIRLHVVRVVNDHSRSFYENRQERGGEFYDAHLEAFAEIPNLLSGTREQINSAVRQYRSSHTTQANSMPRSTRPSTRKKRSDKPKSVSKGSTKSRTAASGIDKAASRNRLYQGQGPAGVPCPAADCPRRFDCVYLGNAIKLHVLRVVRDHDRRYYERGPEGGEFFDTHLRASKDLSNLLHGKNETIKQRIWKYIKDNSSRDGRHIHGAQEKGDASGTDGSPVISENNSFEGSTAHNVAQLAKTIKRRNQPVRSTDTRRTKAQQTAPEAAPVANDGGVSESVSTEDTPEESRDLEASLGPRWEWNNVAIKNENDEEWEDEETAYDDATSDISTEDQPGTEDAASSTPVMGHAASVTTIRDSAEAQITAEQQAVPRSPRDTNFVFKEEPDDDETMDDVPSREATPDDDPSVSNYSWITMLGGLFNSIDDAVLIQ